ncbi:acyl carrier protein [Clostridium homopropionicum DSM 5847]|uniref:Acyl carrier protein n=1 Tax=Clostridium homopropionicum DSM 5847 TaxID=1121318 RepID=A0A0L6Z7W2_9CLOT|nr:acyl carrier protein [Clostridium homopropionicum]KOA19057.1 acyl carrier protein [Clostridium homopropionicum DSM 5847]SFG91775.1 acyl carrier protein [Clostridium homopropionicum]
MIFEKVRKVIAEHLGINEAEVQLDSKFQEDLGVDSLDIFEIAMELEEEFDLEISNEDLEGIKTIGNLVDYISSKVE